MLVGQNDQTQAPMSFTPLVTRPLSTKVRAATSWNPSRFEPWKGTTNNPHVSSLTTITAL